MEAKVTRILSFSVALAVALAAAMPASGQVFATVFADDGTPHLIKWHRVLDKWFLVKGAG